MSSTAEVLEIEPRSGDALRVPSTVFDHAGFRRWVTADDFPAQLHATFVRGEVLLDMSPEELESHNKIKVVLTIVLGRLVKDENLGEYYTDGVLLTHEAAKLSTEPDALFASWDTFRTGRLRPVEKATRGDHYVELQGTPDLVVEVVSDSSVRKDLKLLRSGYGMAGIPEYWIVDARGDAIRFEILHLDGTVYRASAASDEPQYSTVLDRRFALTRTRNTIGRYTYDLTVAS